MSYLRDIDKKVNSKNIIIKQTLMQSLIKNLDVYVKKTGKVSQIVSIDSIQTNYINKIRWYETPQKTDKNLIKTENMHKFNEILLKNIPQQISYLNLTNTSKINDIELINKYIVDNQISFEIPDNITYVFYHIELDSQNKIKNILYMLYNSSQVIQEVQQTTQSSQFIDFIDSLITQSSIIFIMGFQMSIGVQIIYQLQQSLQQIPIYILFEEVFGSMNIQPNIKYSVEQNNTNNGILIQQIFTNELDLSRVYFIDTCQVVFETMPKDHKRQIYIPSFNQYKQSLCNELNYDNELPDTNDTLKEQFKKFNIKFMMSNVLSQKLDLIALLNVPLSFALYQTPVTCITQYTCRQFKYNNYLFMYKQLSDYDDDQDLLEKGTNGGIFEIINPDLKFTNLNYILEGDYQSEYPSIIINFNISPETLVTDETKFDICHKLVLNYKQGQQENEVKYIYFLKKEYQQGIFAQLCDQLLQKRKSFPKDHPSYKSLKTILASIYGFVGMKMSPFYEPLCMKVVCSQGRKACDTAMQCLQNQSPLLDSNCVIARYTDSCQFQLESNGKQMSAQFKKLKETWPVIQNKIQTIMNAPLLKFQLESTFALIKIYLSQINSSVSIIADNPINQSELKGYTISKVILSRNAIINGTDLVFKLQVKGIIQWDKFHIDMKNIFRSILFDICVKSYQVEQTSVIDIAQQLLNIVQQQIQKDIEIVSSTFDFESNWVSNKAIRESLYKQYNNKIKLLNKYSKFKKFSNSDNTSKFLLQVYQIQTSCWILPYIPQDLNSRKKLSECYIPVSILVQEPQLTEQQVIQQQKNKETISDTLFRLKCSTLQQNIKYVDFERFKLILDPLNSLFNLKTNLFHASNDVSDQLIKGVPLKDNQCQVRIEQSAKGFKKCSFVILNTTDLSSVIIKNPNWSFHEVLSNTINKMYFDIESENKEIKEHDIRTQIVKFIRIMNPYVTNIQIHIASASKQVFKGEGSDKILESSKYSFHCVVNIGCSKEINKFIANQINKFLNDSVDVKVYNNNSSLRLPLCCKIDKNGTIEKRPFTFAKEETFSNFIISDISNCIFIMNENILFDTKPPINIPKIYGNIQSDLLEYTLSKIKEITNRQGWFIRTSTKNKGLITFQCKTSYRCFICKRTHDNDGVFGSGSEKGIYINCYSNSTRFNNIHEKRFFTLIQQEDKDIELDAIEEIKETTTSEIDKKIVRFEQFNRLIHSIDKDTYQDSNIRKQSNQFVRFDLSSPTTYVISGMGSGKSTQLIELIKNPDYQFIVCLSFRITFTSEFAKKYDLVSYKDIVGTIRLNKNPRVIIQVDSLFRLDTSIVPDLLIIDEVESILEKIDSAGNTWTVIYAFIDLIRNSKKIVIMDGLMELITIKYINLIRNTDNFTIYHNTMLTRPDYTLELYQYHSTQHEFVVDMILSLLQEGKRIYGMITQKSLGDHICDLIQSRTQSKFKCIFYHGDNLRQETQGMQSHSDLKSEHFKDVNTYWTQYDLVLHSSTVTAGVSFDNKDHFDVQVNILSNNTCSAVSFIQGCHRVRHLRDKRVITFIEPINQQGEHIPINFTNEQYKFHCDNNNPNIKIGEHEQVQCWLLIRKCMSLNRIMDLVIKYSKSMGYQIIPKTIPVNFQGSKFRTDKDSSQKLSSITLPASFDDILQGPLEQRQLLSQKFELANIYNLFKSINTLNTKQIKYLQKYMYVQQYRIKIVNNTELLPQDKEDSHKFWNFENDWLASIKYQQSNMSFGIDMYISQSILKLKDLLLATRNNKINMEQFVTLALEKNFENNILNTINLFQINVKSKKGHILSKFCKTIIAFMFVLCYEVQYDAHSITFVNFSIPGKLNSIKPIKAQ